MIWTGALPEPVKVTASIRVRFPRDARGGTKKPRCLETAGFEDSGFSAAYFFTGPSGRTVFPKSSFHTWAMPVYIADSPQIMPS